MCTPQHYSDLIDYYFACFGQFVYLCVFYQCPLGKRVEMSQKKDFGAGDFVVTLLYFVVEFAVMAL